MFIGHYATGLALATQLKPSRKNVFLVVLATQFVDVLWGIFTILGIEGGVTGGSVSDNYFDVPWSHSLVMMIVWSLLYGMVSWIVTDREDLKVAYVTGFAVFSHWILDMLVHGDDMLLHPFSTQALPTINLWSLPLLTFFVELALIIGCWYYFIQVTEVWQAMEKGSLVVLITYLGLHVFGYLPSFFGGDAMEIGSGAGVFNAIALVVLAAIPAYFVPGSVNSVDTE